MPAIAMPGKKNAWLFWLVPALERGTDQKSDARAPRTAVPRWSVGTIKLSVPDRTSFARQESDITLPVVHI